MTLVLGRKEETWDCHWTQVKISEFFSWYFKRIYPNIYKSILWRLKKIDVIFFHNFVTVWYRIRYRTVVWFVDPHLTFRKRDHTIFVITWPTSLDTSVLVKTTDFDWCYMCTLAERDELLLPLHWGAKHCMYLCV